MRNSGFQAPLAPDHHRLTDDGEVGKVTSDAGVDQQGKQPVPKSSKARLSADSGVHSEDEDDYGGRQVEGGVAQTSGQPALPLQGAVAQIKVRDVSTSPCHGFMSYTPSTCDDAADPYCVITESSAAQQCMQRSCA